jgi:hypothetical protein
MEAEPVAAVCGREVRIYGPMEASGIRPFRESRMFPHRGAALLYASEFDDASKLVVAVKQRVGAQRAAVTAKLVEAAAA